MLVVVAAAAAVALYYGGWFWETIRQGMGRAGKNLCGTATKNAKCFLQLLLSLWGPSRIFHSFAQCPMRRWAYGFRLRERYNYFTGNRNMGAGRVTASAAAIRDRGFSVNLTGFSSSGPLMPRHVGLHSGTVLFKCWPRLIWRCILTTIEFPLCSWASKKEIATWTGSTVSGEARWR